MNWLNFFGPIIAGLIIGLNNFLLIKLLFIHYDKSDSDSIVIEKKEKVKPIKIPKERISLSKRIKNINFYRKGGK